MARLPELTGPRRRSAARGPLCAVLAASAAWFGAMLSGCTVGPDYVAPKTAMPAGFAEKTTPSASPAGSTIATASAAASSAAAAASPSSHDAWWDNFGDPLLDQLNDEALQSAPDLAEAEARVREARALRGIAGAAQYPEPDAGAGYNRTRGSANVPIGVPPGGLGPGTNGNLWQAGFDASWEIDVFGGKRRSVESADASYQAAVDTLATSSPDLARRGCAQLHRVARRAAATRRRASNLAIQQDSLSLTRSQFDAGLASRLDVLRAQAQVSDTESAIPDIRGRRTRVHLSHWRTGRASAGTTARPAGCAATDSGARCGRAGGPALRSAQRRPDIRAAERRIAAANARIGVAQADLYPHFSLTGVAGLESLNASTFLTAPSRYFSIGPGINWLIFDAGKVRFEMRAEEARTDEAAAATSGRFSGLCAMSKLRSFHMPSRACGMSGSPARSPPTARRSASRRGSTARGSLTSSPCSTPSARSMPRTTSSRKPTAIARSRWSASTNRWAAAGRSASIRRSPLCTPARQADRCSGPIGEKTTGFISIKLILTARLCLGSVLQPFVIPVSSRLADRQTPLRRNLAYANNGPASSAH